MPGPDSIAAVSRTRAFLFLFFLCAFHSAAAAPVLEGGNLRLQWADGRGEPVEWQVATPEGSRSLVTRDGAEVIARHLRIDGLEVAEPGWVVSRSGDAVIADARSADGRLRVRRHFRMADLPWRLHLRIEAENISGSPVPAKLHLLAGPGLAEEPATGLGIAAALYSFVRPAVAGDVELVETESGYHLAADGPVPEWFGLHSRYFALLLRPRDPAASSNVRFTVPPQSGSAIPASFLPVMRLELDFGMLAPGAGAAREFLVFAGPKSRSALSAPQPEASFDGLLFMEQPRWMRALCFALLWLLEIIHAVIGNWGLAIILLAVAVRILMYPLARRTLASQHAFAEAQQKLAPELAEIRRKFRGEEQSERILALYNRHGVSPLAGLKPLLLVAVQIPIFIALFHVLGQVFELRAAPFLWMETLAEPDRLFGWGADLPYFGSWFNLLPVLLGATTLLTIRLAPAPSTDPRSRRRQDLFLGLMAAAFVILFYPFPSGLVLYWTAANVLHLAQQLLFSRA